MHWSAGFLCARVGLYIINQPVDYGNVIRSSKGITPSERDKQEGVGQTGE